MASVGQLQRFCEPELLRFIVSKGLDITPQPFLCLDPATLVVNSMKEQLVSILQVCEMLICMSCVCLAMCSMWYPPFAAPC